MDYQYFEKEDLRRAGAAAVIIDGLAPQAEGVFIKMGENLRDFYSRANELYELGKKAAGLMSGGPISDSVEKLQGLVNRMEGCLRDSDKTIGTARQVLLDLRSSIGQAKRPLSDFDRIIKYLVVLGALTRIESARVSRQGQGFSLLGDEVAGLSASISVNAELMSGKLDDLLKKVENAVARLGELESRSRGSGSRIVGNLSSSLGSLLEKQKASSSGTISIAGLSEDVSRHMSEVVSAIQFHDITRQQLEHITAALEGVDKLDDQSEIAGVCLLQASQLEMTKKSFVEATERIAASLEGIAARLGELTSETSVLVGETDGVSFVDRLEGDISMAGAQLIEHQQAVREIADAMHSVGETLISMGDMLKGVETISYSIKMIALNSTIQAGRLGREGEPLVVLALEIRRLSETAREPVQKASEELRSISASAAVFRECESSTDAGVAGGFDEAISGLGAVLSSVRTAHEETGVILSSIRRTGPDLAGRLKEAASWMDIGRTAAGKIDEAISGLKEMIAKVPDRDMDRISSGLKDQMAGLSNRYTMASERRVHEDVWGGSRKPADGEYFHKENETGADGDDLDLGDNVELF
ncbi:MAG: hypothetical protein V1816_07305 [Pseudomonadota bacterium]